MPGIMGPGPGLDDCLCCSPSGGVCPDLSDNFNRPDGPAGLVTQTGQPYTWGPSEWNIVGGMLDPVVSTGCFELGGVWVPQVSCCPRSAPVPFVPSYCWFVEARVFVGSEGGFYLLSFGLPPLPGPVISDFLGVEFSIAGTDVPSSDAVVGLVGFGTLGWTFLAPGRISPYSGGLLRVELCQNGIAAYVDGVPFGFTDVAAWAGLVDPSAFSGLFLLTSKLTSQSPQLDDLRAGCSATIDPSLFEGGGG